jgi:hypothetical protein
MTRQQLRNRRPTFTCGSDRAGNPIAVPSDRGTVLALAALLLILSAAGAEPLLRALGVL